MSVKLKTHGIFIPSDYYRELKFKNKRAKARAFIEYYDDMDLGEHNSVRFYAKSWGVAISTAFGWIDDFKLQIDKYYATRVLKNEQHYNSAKNQTERIEHLRPNTLNTLESPYNGTSKETDRTNSKSCPNKGLHAFNNKYINAELENSANKNLLLNKSSSSKNNKNSYSDNFNILWNEYNKKTGNKNRACSIYKKKFKDTPLNQLIAAIKRYKESKEEWRALKDFDGFLNGMIDIYLPARVWLVDLDNKKHIGYFYDSENVFISDENKKLNLESSKIASLIEQKRFGYIKE